MTKLLRYLKPFSLGLILSVLLLFVQAICDLNLPNYMSNIVNIGIQQNGIQNAAPEAISNKGLLFEKTFMTDEQIKLIDKCYTLVRSSKKGSTYDKYLKKYPLLKTEDIYIQNETDKITQSSLNSAFGESIWTFINTMNYLNKQQKPLTETQPNNIDFKKMNVSKMNIDKIYAMQPIFEKLPLQVINNARKQAASNDVSLLKQTGTAAAAGFYKELGVDLEAKQTGYITKIGLIMLAFAIAGGIATVLVGFMAARISSAAARNLRRDIFNKIESFSNTEFDRFSTSSLITRTTNDITQVQTLLMMGIRTLCYAPIMGVGGIIMALQKSTSMSWIIALACIIIICLIFAVFTIAIPKFKRIQKLIDKLNLISRENLNGLMVIRAFGTQKYEKERFKKTNTDLTRTHRFVSRIMALMMPVMSFVMNGITLLIVWVGAHQIAESAMQVGDMMAFMQYAMQIIMAFLIISIMFIMVPRAAVSGNRIQEVLSVIPSINDPEKIRPFKDHKKGYVEFKNVSFCYDGADENILENITFTAKPGETTAIIGSTGSGKSTLINLIPRFYDVTEGELFVNGTNVKNVSQHDLRNQIGFIPQKGILLSGSIASNLRYGKKDAGSEELLKAAAVSQSESFINESAEGFERIISQGGTNVSGGQKQRLSIARALVKNPAIYIFDDSFSALDFKTESALRHALKKHTGNSTVIIVAQRVSSIRYADQILVIDKGKIVGKGTHEKLLKNCPEYYEIAVSQLTKEELQ